MLKEYLIELLAAKYEDKLIISDFDDLESRYSYASILSELGFQIIPYIDAVACRYVYESELKGTGKKFAFILKSEQYVPYDILKSFHCVDLGLGALFSNLNKEVLNKDKKLDLELLYGTYNVLHKDITCYEETSSYVVEEVYGKANVKNYLQEVEKELCMKISVEELNYSSWIDIASRKGNAEYLAAQCGINIDFAFIDEAFKEYILHGYQSVSSMLRKDAPIMVSRVMDYVTKKNQKMALIVLDGMSVFDFNIIAAQFKDIDYEENYIYAMVPTTTAISRQSLLSGKFPSELERPFNLSREKKEFTEKAKDLGYLENQILYARGYEPNIGPSVKCLSIILNDIDDLVHGQTQGRIGMYNDVSFFAKTGKLQKLIKALFDSGFNIFLTSDHGNTLCTGLGMAKGTGIEVETKSKRMFIFKDFAQSEALINSNHMIEFPGYYLDKQYKYYICDTGTSFDTKGSEVMTHGGISIDEVIVPFIKIKAVQHG